MLLHGKPVRDSPCTFSVMHSAPVPTTSRLVPLTGTDDLPAGLEAPSTVTDALFARQARAWTSKGYAFSTRERFPRVRKRWKD